MHYNALYVMIGMLSSHLMHSEIIVYGLVRKCVKLSPFSYTIFIYILCVCISTTFPEWLSGTEPLPHTPGAVRPSSLCLECFACTCTVLPTFSDTAITGRHSDTTIFQLRAYWVRISWSIGSEKSFGHVPPVGVEPSTSCVQGEHPIN